MSSANRARRAPFDAIAIGLAGLALLGVVVLLGAGGASGTLRTVLAVAAVLVIPGWLVGRLADEDGDAVTRLVGGIVATLGVVAVSGFLTYEAGVRVATAAVAVPLLAVVAVAALLGAAGPPVRRAPVLPVLVALALGATTLLGAMLTHLALPRPPVEPAFSIEAATVVVSPTRVQVTVTVARVRTDEPTQLTLYVGPFPRRVRPTPAAVALAASDQGVVRLTAKRPTGSGCTPSLPVRVVASNGAFLTPPVTCVGG